MTDAEWTRLTGIKVNRAAERRKHAAERAALVAELGMAPEDPTDQYAATTGELLQWAAEKRTAK
jgi:hypothetical protein